MKETSGFIGCKPSLEVSGWMKQISRGFLCWGCLMRVTVRPQTAFERSVADFTRR